jgi:hypothetical protein
VRLESGNSPCDYQFVKKLGLKGRIVGVRSAIEVMAWSENRAAEVESAFFVQTLSSVRKKNNLVV